MNMLRKSLVIGIASMVLLFLLAGCVSSKKYKLLESEYGKMKDNLETALFQLDEKEAQMEQLQARLEEQHVATEQEVQKLKGTYDELLTNLKKEIDEGKIEMNQIRDRLTLSIAEELFFESGKAEIKPEGNKVLDRIAEVLKKVPDKNVRIEGHTDNVPIGPKIRKQYPTNWELGSVRAVNVVRYLQEQGGIDPLRLGATSYAQYRPKATNRTAAGRAKNRRIEIVLVDRDLDLAKKMREKLANE
jgi:chemotaxis protein MotB